MVWFRLRHEEGGLVLEQVALDVFTKGEARQRTVGADHAMTGHEETDRIRGVGATDGACGGRLTDFTGECAIADRPTKGDTPER